MWQPALWILVADWLLRLGFSLHIIMRPRAIGISLAWLMIVLLFPFVGSAVYLFLAENRLGTSRSRWAARLRQQYQYWKSRQVPYFRDGWDSPDSDSAQLSRMIFAASDALPLLGNSIDLLKSADAAFIAMIADIEKAKSSCLMEYYIWEVGGQADELSRALVAAAQRGVVCRILVDAVGSRGFLKSKQAAELRAAGVGIQPSLPVSLIRAFFYRFDLRQHRKIVVIDNAIAYTGSQNMADPKLFKAGAGFGQWVDATIRITGPAVDALLMVFAEDWQFETTHVLSPSDLNRVPPIPTPTGSSTIQVVPSGPGLDSEAIMQILLNTIYMADHQLTLTTPYFVPDESLQRALISAARRGVDVTIVIPKTVDSRLVRLASRPFLRQLVSKGIHVARYHQGMLHTKSITVDDDISFFGSLNLDPRSLHLNFEIMLALYDRQFTAALLQLQREYIAQSDMLLPSDLPANSMPIRFAEGCARLVSPLL